MSEKNTPNQSPSDIAREAFKRLAVRRIAPTPDAYRDVYREISGEKNQVEPDQILNRFAQAASATTGETSLFGKRLVQAANRGDWTLFDEMLTELTPKLLLSKPAEPVVSALQQSAQTLYDEKQNVVLRDMLSRALSFAVASLLSAVPELAQEAESIANSLKDARTEAALNDLSSRLKQLCFQIEMRSGDLAEQQELLLRLFKLLLENVKELVDDNAWLTGQIATVQELLSGPVSYAALTDATRSLKDVIYKQGLLKHSLTEAKATMKTMMLTFIDQLSAMAVTTGDYHKKIDGYSQQISQAKDIGELNQILENVMRDTQATQAETLRSRDQMVSARSDVQAAEARIHELEAKLEHLSELVREDQLTGSLNRRGFEDAFERETSRSERRKTPLCIALLDLDDFKRLNDTLGHSAGDEALIHLVRVIKDTLRSMDVIARFGGEEFLIVLPDTPLDEAVKTITRVQRELTKRIFLHKNEKVLITFSAGVALRRDNEAQDSIIQRADEALYKAKRAGKNRVIPAE